MDVKLEEKTPGIRFNKKGEAEVCVWAPLKKSAAIILADELTHIAANRTKLLDFQQTLFLKILSGGLRIFCG